MKTGVSVSRRDFVRQGSLAGIAIVSAGALSGRTAEKKDSTEEEVSPPEDLMREHGVLKRCLLVYEEAIGRIDKRADLPPEPLRDTAVIIRDFIENYHEKLEEDYLFPRFRKAGKLVELVDVLTEQHQAGRRVTQQIIQSANKAALKSDDSRKKLVLAMRQFIRMYSPHEAREDTVLFPAFRKLVSRNEFNSLGEEFEKKEHELFGEDGFEKMVGKVADIEKKLGIHELSQFTPKA
jgi:hemerythrin-like domain-containing protein